MLKSRTNLRMIAPAAALMLTTSAVSANAAAKVQNPGDHPHDGRSSESPHRQTDRNEKETLRDILHNLEAFLEQLQPEEEGRGRPEEQYEVAIQEAMERLRELRLQQVDLQAAMERAALDNQHLRVRDLQRALVDVQHELQRGEFELQRVMMDREREVERRDLRRMADRLQYVASWGEVAFDSMQAVVMATQAIVEIHLAQDDVAGAIEQLEGLLPRIEKCGSRTAIRFALKDLYMEKGQPQRAADHMLQVVVENSR